MLKLKLKRGEIVFIEKDGKTMGVMVAGYGQGGYHLCISGPKDFKITRENAKDKTPKKDGTECSKLTY